jgi:exodeoxyribonuclease-3
VGEPFRRRKLNEGKGENGNLANREIDFAVISKFLSFPLIDICQKYTSDMAGRGSFPGRSLGAINNETDEELVKRMQRIDFILVSEELGKNAVSGQVYNGEENWYMSDHYPVGVEFKIEK